VTADVTTNPNKALWEKGDFTRIAESMRESGEDLVASLGITKGLYFSQSILLELTRRGSERKAAYEAVQRAAMKTWQGDKTFAENAKAESEITKLLSAEQIDQLCSLDVHFRHVDETFRALGLD